jgi:hypothetical protein
LAISGCARFNCRIELSIDGGVAMTAKRSVVLFAIALFCSSKGVLAQCTAPADWFPHDHTPMPGTANPGNDHCDFHKWSWQTFLWLTQTVDGELRFIKQMYSSEEPFGLERFKSEVQDWDNRDKSQLVLRPRDAKSAVIRGTPEINQPGDNGILIDQNHHPVYYAIHVNKVYFDFMVKREYFDPAKLAVASSVDDEVVTRHDKRLTLTVDKPAASVLSYPAQNVVYFCNQFRLVPFAQSPLRRAVYSSVRIGLVKVAQPGGQLLSCLAGERLWIICPKCEYYGPPFRQIGVEQERIRQLRPRG